MPNATQPPFLWIPGLGPDEAALSRLRKAFPLPEEPMGEAWFMSDERMMYRDLLGDLRDVSVRRLQSALTDIASGTTSFGPLDEWGEWFHFLLPRLVPRSHEAFVAALVELLITAFITQHPASLDDEPYPGFRTDVLHTLGRCMMDDVSWPGGELNTDICLNKHPPECGPSNWYDASGPLSASLFLCLKYLDPASVEPWFESVFSIESPHWRAQILVWLIGAHAMLSGVVKQPSELGPDDHPTIDWDWSHTLNGYYAGGYPRGGEYREFISRENCERALRAISRRFTDDEFLVWQESIAVNPALEAEIAETPYRFLGLYRPTAS